MARLTPTDLALVSALVLGFALVSKRAPSSVVTAPMVFVGVGLLVGPDGLDWLRLELDEGVLHVMAELTLVFVLFGDATRIDLAALRRELGLPVRLLSVGLPLCIFAGALVAKLLMPVLGVWEAATLGAVLAPTDAALGQAVVSSEAVPMRIRQALNVESGLNDGIALPFVLVFASLASAARGGELRSPGEWSLYALSQVTLGPLVGLSIAWLGGRALRLAAARHSVEPSFERLAALSIALLCFAGAELASGNGFIAAFVGGLAFGEMHKGRGRAMLGFLEAEGHLLMLLVFLGFGATLAVAAVRAASPAMFACALLSLTLVRMIPVSLALLGARLSLPSHVFLGWFGPRGLASILYAILLLSEAALPHEPQVFSVVVLTALLSVLLHGLSAGPASALYGRLARGERFEAEHAEVTPHPLRRPRVEPR